MYMHFMTIQSDLHPNLSELHTSALFGPRIKSMFFSSYIISDTKHKNIHVDFLKTDLKNSLVICERFKFKC